MLFLLLLNCVWGIFLTDDLEGGMEEKKELGKAFLEMLHISKLSAAQQAKPHPYMRQVYQLLDTQEARDLGSSDGTLVQSVLDPPPRPPQCHSGFTQPDPGGLSVSLLLEERLLTLDQLPSSG
ncbi:unnamed protein product [Coregonus sp. 'balchen']|nr:unnamed protein product [Coregonus sp. 'balchen']